MDKNRRNFLKGAVAAGGVATFVAGYSGPLEKIGKGLLNGTAGKDTNHRTHGNSWHRSTPWIRCPEKSA